MQKSMCINFNGIKLNESQIKQCSFEYKIGYNFTISNFENNYYLNKIHPCGVPEAIASGDYIYCNDLLSKIRGQYSLFDCLED